MKTFGQYLTEATTPGFRAASLALDFEKALSKFGSKEGTPSEIAKAIEKFGPKYLFEVSHRTANALEPGDVSVWGFFDPETDQEYVEESGTNRPIELIILFSPKDKKLGLTPDGLRWFSRALAETVAHESVHMKQARARKWQKTKTKQSYVHKVENVEVGSYLAHDDEIEAHALTIALALKDQFHTQKERLNFLKRPKAGVLSDHHFDMYNKVFGSGHPVVKRLFKKIVGYLHNEKL